MNFSGRYKDVIHPEKLHVLSLSVLLDKLEDTPGGVGANIAYGAAQLGESPVLLGSVGRDADVYVKELAQAGVVTDFVHISELPTASFNVITDKEDNQVGGFYPGAMSDSQSLSLAPWAERDVFIVISAHDPASMRSQVDEVKRQGMRLLYDPGQQVSNVSGDDLNKGVAAAEMLILNDYEMGVLCKKTDNTPEALASAIPVVVTTYGKDGSTIAGTVVKDPFTVPATTPDKVLDPTGAGDAYRAGFLYGYLRQWELLSCGRLGSVVASFIVEQHGTQVPLSKQAIIERYQQTFNEEIQL